MGQVARSRQRHAWLHREPRGSAVLQRSLADLEEGIASVEDIDASLRAQGFRMGPFELMDLIGHDVNYAVTSTVHAAFYGDSRYRPSHTQRQLVAANWLGRKRDLGFYTYEAGVRQGNEGQRVEGVAERILAMLMNEAADAVFWQVASPADIDTAMQKGVNYLKGLGLGRQLGHPGTHQHHGFLASAVRRRTLQGLSSFATCTARPHVFQLSAFSLSIRTTARCPPNDAMLWPCAVAIECQPNGRCAPHHLRE